MESAYEMMKLCFAVILALIVVATRRGDGSLARRYLGFALVSLGALFWAGAVDAVGPSGDVVRDATLYKHVLLLCAVGFFLSLAGLIASLWCHQKSLKITTLFVGVPAAILCAAAIIVPY